MDVPRDSGLLTRMFPFPFHVFPHRTILDLRFVYMYCFLFMLTPFVLSTRLYNSLFLNSDSPMTRSSLYGLCTLSCMFVLVSRRPLYIRLGMGIRSPSSIYFATTLKV